MRDTIVIGTIGGFVATVVFIVSNWIIGYSLGIEYTSAIEAGANIYLNEELIHTTTGYIMGVSNSILLGCSIGVLIAIVLRISGKDYYLIKGIGISLMWRMGTFGILAPIADVTPWIKNEPQTQLLALLNFIIIGVVSSVIIVRYMKKPRKA